MTGTAFKALCVGVTLVLLGGAVAIGGGIPLSPGLIAQQASDAARNAQIAEDNTLLAAQRTETLGRIANNVRNQVAASERLLETQLRIEESSREGVGRSRRLTGAVAGIREVIERLEARLRGLSAQSERAGAATTSTAGAAGNLDASLDILEARFRVVVRESRELNRKARGFSELRGGLP